MDPNIARVFVLRSEPKFFMVRTHTLPSNVTFTVRSAPLKPFPNLANVQLSGKVVCYNPKKWTPALVGPPEDGVGTRIFVPKQDKVNMSCGRRQIEAALLVTNSTASAPGDWPWHVAIFRATNGNNKYRCGGSIISQNAVLTAAHCGVESARPIPPAAFSVHAGKYHLKEDDAFSKEYKVSQIIIHNQFNPRRMTNDIALFRLTEDIAFTDYAQPICLWSFKQSAKNYLFGHMGTLVGWGSTKPNASLSETLRSGSLTLISDTECLLSNSEFFQLFLTDDTFCAGSGDPYGTSACNGDSGGALAFRIPAADGTPVWHLRGLVSISVSNNGTCDPRYYTVFTDTARYLSWIADNI